MKHFSINEMCKSSYAVKNGITNLPDTEAINNLNNLVKYVLDPAREKLGLPIIVNSGYRSKRLNDAVNGALNSQHLKGEAADITTGSREGNKKLFDILKTMQFDQLIDEKDLSWIHVSFRVGANRKQLLKL